MITMCKKRKNSAVVDTSAIMYFLEKKIDLLDAILSSDFEISKIYIPDIVLGELKLIASKGMSRRARLARIALNYLEKILVKRKENVKIIQIKCPEMESVDDAILSWAQGNDAVIVTADIKLKNRALKSGLKVLVPVSSKSKLREF